MSFLQIALILLRRERRDAIPERKAPTRLNEEQVSEKWAVSRSGIEMRQLMQERIVEVVDSRRGKIGLIREER